MQQEKGKGQFTPPAMLAAFCLVCFVLAIVTLMSAPPRLQTDPYAAAPPTPSALSPARAKPAGANAGAQAQAHTAPPQVQDGGAGRSTRHQHQRQQQQQIANVELSSTTPTAAIAETIASPSPSALMPPTATEAQQQDVQQANQPQHRQRQQCGVDGVVCVTDEDASRYVWTNRSEELRRVLPQKVWTELIEMFAPSSHCSPLGLQPHPRTGDIESPPPPAATAEPSQTGVVLMHCHGQFGNRLGEYTIARIVAETRRWPLVMCDVFKQELFSKGLIFPFAVDHPIDLAAFDQLPVDTQAGHNYDFDELLRDPTPRVIDLAGFPFRNYSILAQHKAAIKDDWLRIDTSCLAAQSLPLSLPGPRDIVVHLRAYHGCEGEEHEYDPTEAFVDLPWDYYDRILQRYQRKGGWDTVWLASRCGEHHPIAQQLMTKYGARVIQGDGSKNWASMHDWLFMRSARRLVMSQSTYAWWAAWLGDAEEVHYPLAGDWWGKGPRHTLYPVDEPRYVFHDLLADEYFLTAADLWGA
ncbi:hypothetical protein PTSG_00248 [Salpingoeca rosetta]|uniref:Uncharacterized protein n=1 Tax=Salpingoeca rosetta (strain ATCC 50818 / BSB-021) TaxID=946362 RepID=F2TVY1_SALR5|nr:uncharacterized protein PTSG_00248 [Salpingoeca rosetta]EGD72227.1 hypothetical protein PTSG_00248 [Salpingoeca rosetta]|eukprot:XP_004998798.1 hypothetical protein PTSG_00248 [Salpingoeca rosetta]